MTVTARLSDGRTVTGALDWWRSGVASIGGRIYAGVVFMEPVR